MEKSRKTFNKAIQLLPNTQVFIALWGPTCLKDFTEAGEIHPLPGSLGLGAERPIRPRSVGRRSVVEPRMPLDALVEAVFSPSVPSDLFKNQWKYQLS